VYPFMKRITYWPQIVLGLAFSWGALMGWPATFARLDLPAFLLYAGAISWVIGYDTIYAHQDREDDALIGIKSTALLFRERTKPMLALFYTLAVALIALAGWNAGAGLVFALGLLAFAAHLAWQIARLNVDDPVNCLVVFKSNRDAGLILFVGLVLDPGLRGKYALCGRPHADQSVWPGDAVAPCAGAGQAAGARARAAPSAAGRRTPQSRAMKRQALMPSDGGEASHTAGAPMISGSSRKGGRGLPGGKKPGVSVGPPGTRMFTVTPVPSRSLAKL